MTEQLNDNISTERISTNQDQQRVWNQLIFQELEALQQLESVQLNHHDYRFSFLRNEYLHRRDFIEKLMTFRLQMELHP